MKDNPLINKGVKATLSTPSEMHKIVFKSKHRGRKSNFTYVNSEENKAFSNKKSEYDSTGI